MLLFLKKKPEEDAALPAGAEATPLDEFIPYHSHYDAQTLITKNGELMQIIRIASNTRGLNYESGEGSGNTVRETIRRAVAEVITSDRYAIWVHTLRKRKPIAQHSHYEIPLAAHLNSKWQKRHKWKHQYSNEIYVSILYEGQYSRLLDKDTLKHVFSPSRNRRYRHAYLDRAAKALDDTVTQLLQHIRPHYNAQRLGIVERTEPELPSAPHVFFSEPVEFLSSLTTLQSHPQPVALGDISKQISPDALIVGFNALETKDAEGRKRFGAMLSLKQYHEIPPETADKLLQAPLELIISQGMRFIPATRALKQYKEQKQMFDISGDSYSAVHTGLRDMLDANKERDVDFAEQQTTILVLADEYKQLDAEILTTQAAFADFGLITIREDIKLEECFWAQLPGNFEFIRRKDPIPASRMGGFARLNRFPTGSESGTHWDEPVALVPTTVGSPFFFNFHHQDNGHTLLLDFNSFGDACGKISLGFLLTAATKFKGRTFIFDRHHASRLLTNKIGGAYHEITARKPRALALNPFALEDSKRNRSFLLAWCVSLLEPYAEIGEAQKETLRAAIDALFAQPPENRSLEAMAQEVSRSSQELGNFFSPFFGRGELAGIFDADKDKLPLSESFSAFSMDVIAAHPSLATPLFSYLMHRVIGTLDGTPTIIVLHEAWDLLENNFFAPRLESLMEMLRQHNAMIIATTEKPQECASLQTFAIFNQQAATKILIPDDMTLDYASFGLGIESGDAKMLTRLSRQSVDCLVLQKRESVALRINLDGIDDVKSILANDIKNLIAAGGPFASLPKE